MSTYAWVITECFIDNDNPDDDGYKSAPVDISGPRDATPDQIERARNEGTEFQLYDDDGILYYQGRCLIGDGDEDDFAPLYDYGMPNDGATQIAYWDSDLGDWVKL